MKKLIVLATLAALPAVAMADVTISGDIGVSLVNTKKKDGSKASKNDMTRQTGQIVFRGSEDLGNGLRAVWQVANRVDASGDETNTWAKRDTFVGLQGAYGQVRFGNLSNPINSGYGSIEPFSEVNISGDGSSDVGEERTANTIRFDTPVFAGVSAAVSTQLRPEKKADTYAYNTEDGSDKITLGNNAAPYAVGFGVKYEGNGLMVSLGTTTLKDQLKGDDNLAAAYDEDTASDTYYEQGAKTKSDVLSATYSFNDVQVGAGYTRTKWTDSAAWWAKQSGYGVFATYALGNVTPKIGYWKEGAMKSSDGKIAGSFNVVTLAVDYALSKRTSAGIEFQSQSARELLVNNNAKSGKKTVSAAYLSHAF